jgi:hypothetical protein
MTDPISLEGPLELHDGKLTLRIPLGAGGAKLAPFAKGIGEVDGGYLNVVIQPWLADELRIAEGSLVVVDNHDGKLRITRSARNDSSGT